VLSYLRGARWTRGPFLLDLSCLRGRLTSASVLLKEGGSKTSELPRRICGSKMASRSICARSAWDGGGERGVSPLHFPLSS